MNDIVHLNQITIRIRKENLFKAGYAFVYCIWSAWPAAGAGKAVIT